jgi:enoyl-[acyl-carrier protein] reductase I
MLMQDRTGFVAGVANRRSIAWAIAKALDREGARLALGYLGERELEAVEPLVEELKTPPLLVQCDATKQDSVDAAFDKAGAELGSLDCLVHAIAFANREDLQGRFTDTSADGFHLALNASAYTLTALARAAEPLMSEKGGAILALTYLGSDRAMRNYNVMGVAKAALESSVRYLAGELGEKDIRVNALSAGPLRTLAARGIGDLNSMLRVHAERSALKRNNTVEEVGDAGLFLCSPWSRGITGEVIYCDAGYRIMGL